jgi:shikimate dehydrogenase
MTRTFGVIGDPIAHSLSPLIHNGWMRDHKIDAEYFALQVAGGALTEGLQTLARRGLRGLNVTLPHKEDALALAQTATSRAAAIGAANTLWRPGDGSWHADNTDAPGFLAALSSVLTRPLKGQRALVLGAGGSARAVVYALHSEGVSILLANRTLSRGEALICKYNDDNSTKPHVAVSLETGLKRAENADFVVNTTSLAHNGQTLDLGSGRDRLFFDLSYGPPANAFAEATRAQGWQAEDGTQMLVYQAAYSFERWFGVMPDIEAGLDRVRRTLGAVS